MVWLWTWSGKCFGYRDGDDLWTYGGRHIGRFKGDEVYAPGGRYLGELMNGRLITNTSKSSYRHSSFSPQGQRAAQTKRMDYVGYAMYAGYEDFPAPEHL